MTQELPPGTLFAGDYRIVRLLARGGMGEVYVAEQLSTRKLRAIKFMRPELLGDESRRRRFEQEARVGANIPSEHVIEVQAAGVDAQMGAPYLVMELLEGEDLEATLQRRGRLPPAEVRLVMEQICHAVGAAHGAGIVHRDLKPKNIFLAVAKRTDVAFTVKVLDFGLAKLVTEHTSDTAAMGSPLWLAPEQTDRSVVSPATDVWALGLVAYTLLTGTVYWRSPRSGESSLMQLMREVLFEPLVPPSSRAAELGITLPLGFDGWFAHAVARRPLDRFPNARQAYAALCPLLGSAAPDWSVQGSGTPPPAPAYAPPAASAGFGATASSSSAAYGASTGGSALATGTEGSWSNGSSFGASQSGATPRGGLRAGGPGGTLALGCAGTGAIALAVAMVVAVALGVVALFLVRSRPSANDGSPPARTVATASEDEPAVPDEEPDPTEEKIDRAIEKAFDDALRDGTSPPRGPSVEVATPRPGTGGSGPAADAAAPARTTGPTRGRGAVSTVFGGSDITALPPNAASVVRSLEPQMLACYNARVGDDGVSHFGETLIFGVTVGAGGEVKRVESRVDTAPPGVGPCVRELVQRAGFSAPPGGQVVGNLIANFSTRD
ncbi:MAG: serine/threonine protein kinase [Polyangiaceae bacterium]|nr:serine/threonine protein kinase [Polyangiaceae bacterium]